MAKKPTTPVQMIDEVRGNEVRGDLAIITLGSIGAEVRLSLTRNATCMLLQALMGSVNTLFPKPMEQSNIVEFRRAG